MCSSVECPESVSERIGKKYRLSSFFDMHWDRYVKSPKHFIRKEEYKAVSALRNCRTASLGIDVYLCDSCGEESRVYHSCKHRFCPRCSWKDTQDWADRTYESLLPIAHRHVVFTLPSGLNDLIKDNWWALHSMLFQSSSESLKDWMGYKYGLTPGIVSVLHTFGERKQFHPHVHMLVSWGGVNQSNELESLEGEYIKYEFIENKFRHHFEDRLVSLYDKGELVHCFSGRSDFLQYLKRINRHRWKVHFEEKKEMNKGLIRYIGRYLKRACISEYKIRSIEGDYISFEYKDNRNLDVKGRAIRRELRMHYESFFPELLQHVPRPYFRMVRSYGVYSARTKSKLKEEGFDCFKEEENCATESISYEEYTSKKCVVCKIPKRYMYTVFRTRKLGRIKMTRYLGKKEDDKPNIEVA